MSDPVGPLQLAAQIAFYIVAGLTVGGAWIAVSNRNLFHSALGLALSLFGVAVIYFFLEAEFLAVTQLLVYVGAILMLIIFGIMLTAQMADPATPGWNKQAAVAFAVCLCLGVALCWTMLQTSWTQAGVGQPPVALTVLGHNLIGLYLLPFELLSLLLVGALVGAVYIARQEKE